jgi:DNA topoisomerase-1
MASLTLEQAVALLAGPRALGPHPGDGAPVLVHPTGKFGPYLSHGPLLVSIPKVG